MRVERKRQVQPVYMKAERTWQARQVHMHYIGSALGVGTSSTEQEARPRLGYKMALLLQQIEVHMDRKDLNAWFEQLGAGIDVLFGRCG